MGRIKRLPMGDIPLTGDDKFRSTSASYADPFKAYPAYVSVQKTIKRAISNGMVNEKDEKVIKDFFTKHGMTWDGTIESLVEWSQPQITEGTGTPTPPEKIENNWVSGTGPFRFGNYK